MNIVIAGSGKIGMTLTSLLSKEDHDITIIDLNPKALEKVQNEFDIMIVQGHCASRSVLEEAGAEEADILIAATGIDEVNLLCCLIARKLGCKRTIARVRNWEYASNVGILREELGLSFVVNPEDSCAREIFNTLQFPSFLGREQFVQGRAEIVRLKVDEDSVLVNLPLTKLQSVAKEKVLVCAVDREGEVTIPDGHFVIQTGDELFISARGAVLAKLIRNLNLASHRISHVTMVGGSRVAFYLSFRLIQSHVGVRIIERNPQRCQELSELLPEADIVEGDGTDQDVLLAEGIKNTDALIALTGIDEENIVLSMYAQKLNVPTIITKCGRLQYNEMLCKLGIDNVVSPQMSCSEEVARYIRAMETSSGNDIVTMHSIAGGKAEALEFVADKDSRIVGKPLSRLNLKKGTLISSISHGAQTMIPAGDSIVQRGDSVVIVATGHHIKDLDDILEDKGK